MKTLPKHFYVKTPNLKIWKIVKERFNELGYDFPLKNYIASPTKSYVIDLGRHLSTSPLDYYEPSIEVSLTDFLSLEFAPKVETFKLNAEYSVEIQKGKVIIWGGEMKGRSVTNATIRKIAALEDKRFLVRAPSFKIYEVICNELPEDAENISIEEQKEDWKEFNKETVIDWEGEHESANFYKKKFPNVPYISLEEFLSRDNPFKVEKKIKIGPHEVWIDGDEVVIGCQRVNVKVVKELAAKLI